MFIVRVLAFAAKPALAGAALTAAAAGGYFAIDSLHPNGGGTAFEQIQDDGQRLIISEFSENTDTIVAIDPANVGDRTTIATIDHARDYGVFPVLSPDGTAIAYTGLPATAARPSPATPAQAAVVDLHGDVSLLADDIDLLVPPLWSPDSSSIVVRKNTPGSGDSPDATDAGSFDLVLLGRDGSRATLTSWSSASLFPIAFTPDGSAVYFATLNDSGTDLFRVGVDGHDEAKVAHLSDGIARDWKLSRDGSMLAYSETAVEGEARAVTKTLDVGSETITDATASPDPARAEYNPAWDGDGKLSIAAVKPDGGGDAIADAAGAAQQLTDNTDSIDLPLDWSPDSTQLAVRSVEGASEFDAGASHIDLVARDGSRQRVSDSPDVIVVGWTE